MPERVVKHVCQLQLKVNFALDRQVGCMQVQRVQTAWPSCARLAAELETDCIAYLHHNTIDDVLGLLKSQRQRLFGSKCSESISLVSSIAMFGEVQIADNSKRAEVCP